MNLREKLITVYQELDHVEKAGRNQKQGYNFVRSADVLREVRKVFAAHRICVETADFELLGTYDIKTNAGGTMHSSTVKVTIIVHDADSDEKMRFCGLGDGADSGDKGIYKAQTGAVKNALRNGLLLPDEADPEADERVDEATQAPAHHHKSTPRQVAVVAPEPEPEPEQEVSTQPIIPIADGGVLPDDATLQAHRNKVIALTTRLSESGELKASRGVRVSTKVLAYILKVTGATEAAKISALQWETFWSVVSEVLPKDDGLKHLAKLINAANKESK